MDEIQLIRTLFADTPAPTLGEMKEARRQLNALAGPQHPKKARWAAVLRPRTVIPALAGVTAITAAVAVTTQSGSAPAPSPRTTSPGGNAVLLSAADVAAKAPAETARYWVTANETNDLCAVTGSGGTYKIADPSYEVSSADVSANVTHNAWRDLGAKPAGKHDEQVWRRSGAPNTWKSCKDSARDTGWVREITKSSQKEDTGLTITTARGIFPDGTLADLQRLPTDPTKLRAHLIAAWPKHQGMSAPGMSDQNWETYTLATQILEDEPAPPAVRSAAYKVIANLPGVHVAGTVTDPLGRRGIAVYPPRTGFEQDYFVFDPATGRVLADESTVAGHDGTDPTDPLPIGTVDNWTAYLAPAWTNTPPDPASLQFPKPTRLAAAPVTTPSIAPSDSPSS